MLELLESIFKKQRELMDKYHDIEAKSGIFNYQDGNIPVDINTVGGQARLKGLSWMVMEEVSESLDSLRIEEAKEELADGLHFLIELYISAGLTPSAWPSLGTLFKECPVAPTSKAVSQMVYNLGLAMHELKNKPWKQTKIDTDKLRLYQFLKQSLYAYVTLCKSNGIHDEQELYDLYTNKHQVNRARQDGGY